MPTPLFQHRHFKAIAAIIADCYGVEQVALHFADKLQGTNRAYSATRFYSAAIDNKQTVKRCRLAVSSALGAVRIQQYRKVRADHPHNFKKGD